MKKYVLLFALQMIIVVGFSQRGHYNGGAHGHGYGHGHSGYNNGNGQCHSGRYYSGGYYGNGGVYAQGAVVSRPAPRSCGPVGIPGHNCGGYCGSGRHISQTRVVVQYIPNYRRQCRVTEGMVWVDGYYGWDGYWIPGQWVWQAISYSPFGPCY